MFEQIADAFGRAGMPPAATRFLTACQDLAIEALVKCGENPDRATIQWLRLIEGPKFRDGALREFIAAVAESLKPNTALAKATSAVPQGQAKVAAAGAGSSSDSGKATLFQPQGHNPVAAPESEPETIAGGKKRLPQDHDFISSAIVPTAATGVTVPIPKGQSAASPAAAPRDRPRVIPRPSRVNNAGWEKIMRETVLDTFMIETRDGRVAVGNLHIASIDRQIRESGRRAFEGAGQYNLLLAVRETAKRKAAHIPENAKVRDILGAEEVETLINDAKATLAGLTRILLPKALEPSHAAA